MNPYHLKDQRRCLRFSIELAAVYKKPGEDDFSNAVTLDISATGICFVSDEELEPGLELMMKIQLPPNETVVLKTQVIWVKSLFGSGAHEFRVGVKIMEPIQFDESKFVKFCARMMLDLFRPS